MTLKGEVDEDVVPWAISQEPRAPFLALASDLALCCSFRDNNTE